MTKWWLNLKHLDVESFLHVHQFIAYKSKRNDEKCKKVTEKWHIYIMFLFNWIKLTKFQHPFWMSGELLSECSIFKFNFSSFIPPPEIARGSYMPWVFVQYLILIELDLNVFLTVQSVFFLNLNRIVHYQLWWFCIYMLRPILLMLRKTSLMFLHFLML